MAVCATYFAFGDLYRRVTYEVLVKIARVLKVEVTDLVEESPIKATNIAWRGLDKLKKLLNLTIQEFKQGWQGSNSRQPVLETGALPTELHP